MRSMRSFAILQLTLVGIFVIACGAFAEVPRLINYQGTITGTNGPLDGSFDLAFRVYSDSLSGTALWTELHTRVNINYGVFSVILGSVTAIPDGLLESPERWIGITVGSDPEVSPRMKITSVPWALRAAKADTSLYASSTKIIDGQVTAAGLVDNAVTASKIADANVTTVKLADNAVTRDKIAGGQVVKSINSLKDDVTLAAGANVTITPNGDTLTIAAAGGGGSSGAKTTNGTLTDDVDWTWDGGNHYLYPTDINPSLKVGIGTATPQYPLHVEGSVSGINEGVVHIINTSGINATGLVVEGLSNAIKGLATNPDGCGNGVVGLSEGPGSSCGASTGAGVAGLHGPETGGEGGIGVFAHNWDPDGFAFYGQGGKNYFENNVGIGTKTPTDKLDVDGTARIRDLPADTTLCRVVVADDTGVLHRRDAFTLEDDDWYDLTTDQPPVSITGTKYTMGNVVIGTRNFDQGLPFAHRLEVRGIPGISDVPEGMLVECNARDNGHGAMMEFNGMDGHTVLNLLGCIDTGGIPIIKFHPVTQFGDHYGSNAHEKVALKVDMQDRFIICTGIHDSNLRDVFCKAGSVDALVVCPSGKVGIGTLDPDAQLTIKAGAGETTVLKGYDAGGNETVTIGTGFDYSETFPTSQLEITPGKVMVIDPVNKGSLAVSSQAYDKKVAGIVAGANGLGSGVRLGSSSRDSGEHAVALAGRVYCNVDTKYGDIQPGDLLTTSPTPGHAMVVRDFSKAQGAILGKAMEGLSGGGKGQILVLVTLQ